MKKLILATVLAFAATAAAIAPTQAASVTIQSDDGNQYSSDEDSGIVVRRHHERRYDNEYDGDQSVQYDNDGYRWRHRHHRCHIETVVHWRHHHRVVEDVRVCG
ncbi:hypothetical protein FJ950_25360 [Mesorhizobium sp. B2-3-14]|uniref:hypothetical protein n=1 Tax=unclassified Mesorhizobium TaxID=325217 RepID=UPI00112735A7|nr:MULTISPECIES: hypothetical protein [unclassified Mesorhizobium]TPK77735.1 hypothetical protein FJ527_11675 [Mesorhizobium sp. B2-4-18]TPL80998.1 hypothetical protein FJ950_25360 [Mesorhizobium sp. B2-3-14]